MIKNAGSCVAFLHMCIFKKLPGQPLSLSAVLHLQQAVMVVKLIRKSNLAVICMYYLKVKGEESNIFALEVNLLLIELDTGA